MKEYNLKQQWKSPNGTIRSILVRKPFSQADHHQEYSPCSKSMAEAIIIGRHAYGDIYRNVELVLDRPGLPKWCLPRGTAVKKRLSRFMNSKAPGWLWECITLKKSIRSFAQACINYAIGEKVDLWFGAKDTISKQYHGFFRDVFAEEVGRAKDRLAAAGISYRYMLIDDAVAQVIKSPGGMLWACMNYDGDVMSDMVATGFGSLGLMTSVLVSRTGNTNLRLRMVRSCATTMNT